MAWTEDPGGLVHAVTKESHDLVTKQQQSIPVKFFCEHMMLKLKLQYFGLLMQRADSLEKTDAGRDWGQEEKGTTEDEMAGWHH